MEKGLVSIDRWVKGSQAYFLTHLHADHTRGLSSLWTRGPLFCSPITARLLPSRFPGLDSSLIRVLEIGFTHSITLISKCSGSEVHILVTPIDANHCPGAVMYLFRGEFGTVLHTGDFRWELDSERAQLARRNLLDALGGERVDLLYLDNTYCHPFFSFPTREVAAQQVVDFIKQHPNDEIIIAVDNLGKENLLVYISQALGVKIWVWPERLKTMHILGFDDIFTTDTSLTRVRAVPRYSFTLNTLEGLNTMCPTIGIMPSGLTWGSLAFEKDFGYVGLSESEGHSSEQSRNNRKRSANGNIKLAGDQIKPPWKFQEYSYSFPYSDHACFSEIQELMRTVLPKNVFGIVSASSFDIHPCHHFDNLNCELCTVSGSEISTKVRGNHLDASFRKKLNRKAVLHQNLNRSNVKCGRHLQPSASKTNRNKGCNEKG
ncbi:DNA cross-link repair 1B protein [Dioscorea alata]|uniref:DNA cross-link repair 1B protein n=1 Tax=Dioscorea alata TaxID=55571 RepID=A0ACB7UPH7_DIOAL|nr:DNA cross-link repair 1B protein [Dioscorea alata]